MESDKNMQVAKVEEEKNSLRTTFGMTWNPQSQEAELASCSSSPQNVTAHPAKKSVDISSAGPAVLD